MKPHGMDRNRWVAAAALVGFACFMLGAATPGGQESQPEVRQAPLLVTSSLGASSAVLFVVDPDSRTLALYEAIPGQDGGLRLLGARKIDHDLRLTRYQDQSEFSYSELRDRYDSRATQKGEGQKDGGR